MYNTCPKCQYQRQPADTTTPDACPACGLIFSKWLQQYLSDNSDNLEISMEAVPDSGERIKQITEFFVHVEDRVNPFYFWGRVLVFVGVLVWGWQFIRMDFVNNPFEMGQSWMHLINLVFHEAGHIVFMPFGRNLTILGGTLGQLLMPLVVMMTFLWKHKNTFGASIGLWWLGQSCMDVAPYADDALDQKLVLLGGKTGADAPGNHDWNNLLAEIDMLEHHRVFATGFDTSGTVLMLLAFAWGGYILFRQYQHLDRF